MEGPKWPVKEMSKMGITEDVGNENANTVSAPVSVSRTNRSAISNLNDGIGHRSSSPTRQVERNKSGPLGRMMKGGRAPPKRSKSSQIGRPTFDPCLGDSPALVDQQSKRRGIFRSQSSRVKGTTRNAPGRSGSFQRRRLLDRTSSSSSLRRSTLKSGTTGTVETDDVSVTDSVYTSISIHTVDSIMIRKRQIPLNQGEHAGDTGMSIEFKDSENWTEQSDGYDDEGEMYEYEDELSVFSESWCSSESCEVLSDYEEGEMDGAIMEDDEDGDENEKTTLPVQTKKECTNAE